MDLFVDQADGDLRSFARFEVDEIPLKEAGCAFARIKDAVLISVLVRAQSVRARGELK